MWGQFLFKNFKGPDSPLPAVISISELRIFQILWKSQDLSGWCFIYWDFWCAKRKSPHHHLNLWWWASALGWFFFFKNVQNPLKVGIQICIWSSCIQIHSFPKLAKKLKILSKFRHSSYIYVGTLTSQIALLFNFI